MRSSARPSPGLTGYRYLVAVGLLVALAAVPMVLAVAAGLTMLTGSPSPEPEPFLRPAPHSSADHELRVMVEPDQRPEAHDRGGVECR